MINIIITDPKKEASSCDKHTCLECEFVLNSNMLENTDLAFRVNNSFKFTS